VRKDLRNLFCTPTGPRHAADGNGKKKDFYEIDAKVTGIRFTSQEYASQAAVIERTNME
jgi:hypothetical protein